MMHALAFVAFAALTLPGTWWLAELGRLSITETGVPNLPPVEYWGRVARLAWIAHQLEAAGGRITSAFRNTHVNVLARGVDGSAHTRALALDVVARDPADAPRLAAKIADLKARGFILKAFVHDVGSGDHWHIEVPESELLAW